MSDATYREAVTAFYTGLAAMQTSQDVLARQSLERVTVLVPHEPAGWANLGLLLLRQQEIEPAMPHLTKAAELSAGSEPMRPAAGIIQRLLALAEGRRGNLEAAITHWRKAVELEPNDVKAAYALALEVERQGGADHDAEAQKVLEALIARQDNLVARLDLARLAAKRGDGATLQKALAPLTTASASWPPEVQERFKAVAQAASGANPRAAAPAVAFLKNVLMRVPEYRRSLAEVSTPREEVGEPFEGFASMSTPSPQPAPPDLGLRFAIEPVAGVTGPVGFAGVFIAAEHAAPQVLTADGRQVRIGSKAVGAFPGGAGADPADHPRRRRGGPELRLPHRPRPGRRRRAANPASAGRRQVRRRHRRGQASSVGSNRPSMGRLGGRHRHRRRSRHRRLADGRSDGRAAKQRRRQLRGAAAVCRRRRRPRRSAGSISTTISVPDAVVLDTNGTRRVFENLRGGQFRETPDSHGLGHGTGFVFTEAAGRGRFGADVDNNGAMDVITSTPTTTEIQLEAPSARLRTADG